MNNRPRLTIQPPLIFTNSTILTAGVKTNRGSSPADEHLLHYLVDADGYCQGDNAVLTLLEFHVISVPNPEAGSWLLEN
jgi:hypothetical protein